MACCGEEGGMCCGPCCFDSSLREGARYKFYRLGVLPRAKIEELLGDDQEGLSVWAAIVQYDEGEDGSVFRPAVWIGTAEGEGSQAPRPVPPGKGGGGGGGGGHTT